MELSSKYLNISLGKAFSCDFYGTEIKFAET